MNQILGSSWCQREESLSLSGDGRWWVVGVKGVDMDVDPGGVS